MGQEGRWPKSDSCFRSRGTASGHAGFAALPHALQQTSVPQPQLLAVLCLMRYEDWTFREAEVRLREHHELRAALHLPAVPDYTTLYRFLRGWRMTPSIADCRKPCVGCGDAGAGPLLAAIDGTGLSDTSVSTFFTAAWSSMPTGPGLVVLG